MFIKYVTIEGFKSYHNKTVVGPFHPGQNIVLGRNGSGKSNFFFAVEFVLSREFSSLNTTQRTSLLHSGAGKRSLNAYVDVLFEDSDSRINGGDVSIRRVIGLKTDHYYINGKIASSKNEVFSLLDTIGFSSSNPYNIVKQGQVRSVASCSDEERMNIVMEVAGTKVYRNRMPKLREELETSRLLLEAAATNLSSLDRSIAELDEEQKVLKTYIKLENEKKTISSVILQRDIEDTNKALQIIGNDRERLAEDFDVDVYERLVSKKAELDLKIGPLKRRHEKINENLADKKGELDQLTAEITNAKLQLRDLESSTQENSQCDLKRVKELLELKQQELLDLEENHTSLLKAIEKINTNIDDITSKSDWIRSKKGHSKQFKSTSERNVWLKSQVASLERQLETTQHQFRELREGEKTTAAELSSLDAAQSNQLEEMNAIKARIDEEKERLIGIKAEKERQDAGLRSSEDDVRRQQLKVEEKDELMKERRNILFSSKEKPILMGWEGINQFLKGDGKEIKGYIGILADLFECDDAVLTAVDQTAGNRLFYHVVDNRQTATRLISEMNRRNMRGDFRFLSQEELRPHPVSQYPASQDNSFCPLISKIKYNEETEKCMQFVFGRTMLCRNIQVATTLSPTCGLDCVTMDGDKVSGKGVLSGGYICRDRLLLKKYAEYCNIKRCRDDVFANLTQGEETVKRLNSELRRINYETMLLENSVTRNLTKQEQLESDLGLAAKARRDLVAKAREISLQLNKKSLDMNTTRATIADYKKEMRQDMNAELRSDELSQLNKLEREVTEARIMVKSKCKQLHQIEKEKGGLENQIEVEIVPQIEEIQSCLASSANRESEMKRLGSKITFLREQKEKTQTIIQVLIEREKDELIKIRGLSKIIEDISHRYQVMEKKKTDFNLAKEQCCNKLAKLKNILVEKQKNLLELGSVHGSDKYKQERRKDLLKQLEKISQRIQRTEDVNRKALVQYKTLCKNKEELDAEEAELKTGLDRTKAALEVQDEKKLEQFHYTLKEVKKYFCELFKTFAPSGSADIVFKGMDSTSLPVECQSGLMLKVSFSGSQAAKSVRQLSGGQKSAVSLLFILAIQKCDPAPFYLFDEVDAALDEGHREAMSGILQRQSKTSQFITTTFRAELIGQADRFFGVFFRDLSSKVEEISKEKAIEFVRDQRVH